MSNISIIIFSFCAYNYVSDTSSKVAHRNHFLYSNITGYNYTNMVISRTSWRHRAGGNLPLGWGKVYALLELLSLGADYYFYLDSDCIFLRADVRIEQFLHKNHKYSLYVQEVFNNSRMTQSHAFIVKNSLFGRTFVQNWWNLRRNCFDNHMEQGAFYFTIAESFQQAFPNSSKFHCARMCPHKFDHNRCYHNWMISNGFGPNTPGDQHPHIYIYTYNKNPGSPQAGFTQQVKPGDTIDGCPFTIHPCKEVTCRYIDPRENLTKCI